MQLAEFKAWFEGYTEAMTATPTKAQWARIKERIAELDGKPITERVFIDRYWPTYWPSYPLQSPHYHRYTISAAGTSGFSSLQNAGYTPAFNSTNCMYLLGKQEADAA